MKSKVMKKNNDLPVQNFKIYSRARKISTKLCYKISHLILEHVYSSTVSIPTKWELFCCVPLIEKKVYILIWNKSHSYYAHSK